ncbi:class I SAM-dependent methyltransferase [Mariprofundus sp. NF]|uniref:class I SAM-dependent methyltransferase n=1 Tax=Mariprofundus sp. NF TaxID=2608716 RepID=UPI0015A46558|nr:class I SAM-dependent methyltransferase [Mariprofundus sp. NF]NWF38638.1 class I SAM-dependent methyltransferase [Mariprofundus sp. NF]
MSDAFSKDDKLSLDATLEGAVRSLTSNYPDISGTHLDIGSGTGNLIRRIRQEYDVQSCACDYTDEFMELDGVTVNVVDLNDGKLPYADQQFDLVTFTEVAEHLENYRAIIREIHRVLKPGGVVVITTPNVLNMKSRMRFLITGFWSMFGPLHVGETSIESAGGHITPIPYPYLAHALMDSGFDLPAFSTDKIQFHSLYWFILFYLPIQLLAALSWKKERNKYRTLDKHNEPIIKQINSTEMLLGRCIVVSARKPDPECCQ